MNFARFVLAMAFVASAGLAVAEDPSSGKQVEGEWKLISIEKSGRQLPEESVKALPGTIMIGGGKIRGIVGDKTVYESDFIVNAAASPKTYEMRGGKDRKGKEVIVRGIFEIDADGHLRKCFTTGATAKPPKSFNTKETPGAQLNVYERVK